MITDTDGCTNSASEADQCVGHGRASEPSNHRWFSFGLAALLAALVGAGVLLLGLSGQAAGNAFLSAAQVAVEEAVQNFAKKPGTGCENWKSIALGKAVERESAEQCRLDCVATPGCMYSNYQPEACSGPAQTGPNMCYLFAGNCHEENNTCWDLYETSPATPFPFESPKKGTGCSNWKELTIGLATIVWNEFECGNLCQKEEGCSDFNFQPSPCSGKAQVGKGACYLFRKGCKQEENRCWDLYVSAPNPPYIPITYKAAVAQVGLTYDTSIVEAYAQRASAEGAQILVFPENGEGAEQWPSPDPDKDLCNPDDDGVVSRLACIGKKFSIYLVVQIIDVQPCNSVAPGLCWQYVTIEDGVHPSYVFNADEVIAPNGALVAKYFKHSLFQGTAHGLTQTIPQLSEYFNATGIFEAFGVKFGIAICFDLTNRALLENYTKQGITDLVFSNTWDNGISQQTMANIIAGASYSYGLNIVGASTSTLSSGSGLYSNGDILAVKFKPECVPLVHGIDPPKKSPEDCNDLISGDVISPPPAGTSPASAAGLVPELVEAKSGNLKSSVWPEVADVEDCLGIVVDPTLQMFLEGLNAQLQQTNVLADYFGPGSSYANPEVAKFVESTGGGGKCLRLKSPGVGIWNSSIQTADGRVSCSVSAKVIRAASGESNVTYLLRAFSGKAYVSGTPCPLAISTCTLARCLSFDGNGVQCESIDVSGASPPSEALAEFQAVQLTSSVPAGSVVIPMMSSGDRLQPVSPRSLTLQGPWKASATTATTQELLSLAAVDDALAGGTFGFITSYGSTPVVWPHVCNNCFSPYDMCNTSEAFAQGPLRQLMQCPSGTTTNRPSCSATQ